MHKEIEILLVEDNPNDAELAIRALKMNDISRGVVRVCDGEEALDYIYARGPFKTTEPLNLPRLILLDWKLPKISGSEVLKVVKSDPLTKLIPVVVLTSSVEQKDIIESYDLGANSYIVKPVDFEMFLISIRDIVSYWLKLNKHPDIKSLIK